MDESKPYNGLLGLDKLPTWVKIVVWLAILMLAVRESAILTDASLAVFKHATSINGYDIYIIASAVGINCFVGAGLRLAGIRWLYIFAFWLATIALLTPIILYLSALYYITLQG